MSDETVSIDGTEYKLRKWPALPGTLFSKTLMAAIADAAGVVKSATDGRVDFSIDGAKVLGVLSDKFTEQCFCMVAEGLEFEDRKKALNTVKMDFSFEAFTVALEEVLAHNLVFLKDRLSVQFETIRRSFLTFTQPVAVSPAPAALDAKLP